MTIRESLKEEHSSAPDLMVSEICGDAQSSLLKINSDDLSPERKTDLKVSGILSYYENFKSAMLLRSGKSTNLENCGITRAEHALAGNLACMINVEVGDGHEDDHGDEHGGGHGDEAPPDPPVLPVVDDLVPVFLRQNGVLVQVTVIARQNLLNAGSFPNIHPILAELLANLDNPAIPDADNYVVTFETAITLEQLAEEFFPLPETFAEAIEDLSRIVVFDLN